jgi:prepilin-type N-terminal cleavage/methylation domain-containing protein
MKATNLQRGFTLMETMIYIALFSVLIGGAVVSAYHVLQGGNRNQEAVEVQQEGTFINRKVNWEIAKADSAQIVSGALVLQPGNVVIKESSGRITLARAGGTEYPLNAEPLTISGTTFTVIPGTGGSPTSVRMNYTVKTTPFTLARYLRD